MRRIARERNKGNFVKGFLPEKGKEGDFFPLKILVNNCAGGKV